MDAIVKKIYLFLVGGVLFLVLIGITSNFYIQKTTIENGANDTLVEYETKFSSYINDETKMMESFLSFIINKPSLQSMFNQRDKKNLYDISKEIYNTLNQNNDITHFYFIEPSGKVFLRVHDYKRDGDIINRFTFEKAKQTQQTASGLEFGLKKNYTLRVVTPWIINNELIGYVEIGKEIDKIIETLSQQLDMNLYFAVNKNEYINAPSFVKQQLNSVMQTKKEYIVYSTGKITKDVVNIIDTDKNHKWITIKDNHYISYTYPLQDISKKELGTVLHLINITKSYEELKSLFSFYIVIILIVTIGVLSIAYFFYSRKQKELDTLFEQLESKKQEFETIFNYVQDGISITDLEGNFLNCNKHFLEMSGFTFEEILQENCNNLTAPEYRNVNKKAITNAIENGSIENIEKECVLKNGKRIYVNMSISLLPDKKRLLLLIHDNTTHKVIQEQAKLATLSEMIGNIAHQWRQPLTVISTNASGVSLQTEFFDIDKDTIKNSMSMIVQQTEYLSKTIDDFRNFITGSHKVDEAVHINKLITEVVELTKATLTDNYIQLNLCIEDDIEIMGNKNELEQALINIINNAKDALKENIKNEDDRYIFLSTHKINEDKLDLTICDSAGGIPIDIINKIFEPYFTTKHQSIGTGLGLSMVNKIIYERHNFIIDVYNESCNYKNTQYKGACFKITFNRNF